MSMGVGRADWTRASSIVAQEIANLNINVNAQSLERLIEAPSYGGARYVSFSGSMIPGDSVTVANVTGTGIIYGGHLKIDGVQTPDRFGVGINIDGLGFPQLMLAELNDREIQEEPAYYYFLTRYDATNYIYIIKFSRWITFESAYQIALGYLPTGVGTANYKGTLIYALR